MNPWRWRKAIRKRPRKCNGKSISEGAEQQSWWNELHESADYLFTWGETRTSPSWALFVLCKLSTCSFRDPLVGKSIFIQLEWSFVGQFLSSFAFFITPSLRPFSLFSLFLESVMRTMMLNLSLFSSFQKNGFCVFKASRSSRKSKVFLYLGSVFICRSSDRRVKPEGGKRQSCVRLRSDCSSTAAFWFSE